LNVVVPRIIHQIWVGPNGFPDEFRGYQRSWQQQHPDWVLRFWTEDNLPDDLQRPEALDRLRTPAERSDILRLEVLHREGGVYVDTDFECRRPLDPHIEDLDFFTAYLKPGRVNNAFIGSVPGHPILERALREMQPREFYGYDKAAAGPLFLDQLLKQYADVKAFDPPLFYPNTPEQQESAIAIHHQARSWKDAAGFRDAALRAEQRLRDTQRQLEKSRAEQGKTQRELDALRKVVLNDRPLRGRLAMLRSALRRSR